MSPSQSDAAVTQPAFVSHQVAAARRFYLNLRPRPHSDFVAVCGGWEKCASDYIIRRPTFQFQCVEFVASGEGEVMLNGSTRPLRAGSIFCYGPGVRHEIRSSQSQPLSKYFVDFVGRRARRLMQESGLLAGRSIEILAVGDVRSEFDALIRLGLRKDGRTERMCALQLELLLHTIARSGSVRSVAARRARAAFENCRNYIDENFLTLRSLSDVAAGRHLEKSHVCRLFKRFHSESPQQYLQRRRMHWAADRLQLPDVLVREIADELEMDAFEFSRTFKRVHGLSPLAFLRTRG